MQLARRAGLVEDEADQHGQEPAPVPAGPDTQAAERGAPEQIRSLWTELTGSVPPHVERQLLVIEMLDAQIAEADKEIWQLIKTSSLPQTSDMPSAADRGTPSAKPPLFSWFAARHGLGWLLSGRWRCARLGKSS